MSYVVLNKILQELRKTGIRSDDPRLVHMIKMLHVI